MTENSGKVAADDNRLDIQHINHRRQRPRAGHFARLDRMFCRGPSTQALKTHAAADPDP